MLHDNPITPADMASVKLRRSPREMTDRELGILTPDTIAEIVATAGGPAREPSEHFTALNRLSQDVAGSDREMCGYPDCPGHIITRLNRHDEDETVCGTCRREPVPDNGQSARTGAATVAKWNGEAK